MIIDLRDTCCCCYWENKEPFSDSKVADIERNRNTHIDLITRSTPNYIDTLTTTDGLSDHFTVIVEINVKYNPVNSKCNIL